jgi:hypothetical protein
MSKFRLTGSGEPWIDLVVDTAKLVCLFYYHAYVQSRNAIARVYCLIVRCPEKSLYDA